MTRRATLPGAAELFRATGEPKGEPADAGEPVEPEPELVAPTPLPTEAAPATVSSLATPIHAVEDPSNTRRTSGVRRTQPTSGRGSNGRVVNDRGPSGRERHDEKITVYCSPDELLDLESARLRLRADHGLAVDRGRIVREAVAVVLADLAAKGESSILVRRLREA
jgi:hypothetical protein